MTAQGKWKITIKTPLGDKEGMLNLAVDGTSLSGSLFHAEHFAAINNGKIDGNKLEWSAKITKPVRMTIKFAATVEGDRIQGKAKYLLGSASFSGSRI
ncbi:MAG: hypothetical protein ABSG18_04515 [Steroidobacteraceae bacterium]|jgi:hypothetical protein